MPERASKGKREWADAGRGNPFAHPLDGFADAAIGLAVPVLTITAAAVREERS